MPKITGTRRGFREAAEKLLAGPGSTVARDNRTIKVDSRNRLTEKSNPGHLPSAKKIFEFLKTQETQHFVAVPVKHTIVKKYRFQSVYSNFLVFGIDKKSGKLKIGIIDSAA